MPILPRVPGHEVVGEVVAVGDRVHNIKVGERVGGGWVSGWLVRRENNAYSWARLQA